MNVNDVNNRSAMDYRMALEKAFFLSPSQTPLLKSKVNNCFTEG